MSLQKEPDVAAEDYHASEHLMILSL